MATKYFIHVIVESYELEDGVPVIGCEILGGPPSILPWLGEEGRKPMLREIFEEVFVDGMRRTESQQNS